jgi:uncharacterized protein YbaR (Trm112 family)
MSKAESVLGPTASIPACRSIDLPLDTQRVDDELLEVLCCPVTHQTLRIADQAALMSASAKASRLISEGLIREDGKILYPLSNGIPLLVPEEGIPL